MILKRIAVALAACLPVTLGTQEIIQKPVVVERVVEVEKSPADIKTLLKEIPPRHGVDPLIMAAIVERESGGRVDAIRFEPSQISRAAKITKNAEQQRMYASSHCFLQIMGWHAPAYGLSWSDLYEPETCVEVGSKILADCMKRHASKVKHEQIFRALQCYNGSEEYARAVYSRLADLLIERTL